MPSSLKPAEPNTGIIFKRTDLKENNIVMPGIYNVEVLQVKDKKVINEDNKKIVIKKTGIGNKIYNFAQKQPVFYGILSIIFAVISGIMAATAFRRL